MEQFSEQKIALAIQEGSQAAFHILYDTYAPLLLGSIKGMVMNGDIADIILQKVFREIWKRKQNFDASKSRLFIWLLQIAREITIDTIRSGKLICRTDIEKLQHCVFHREMELLVNGKNTSYTFITSKEKSALQLVYFKGYSITDAASAMGLSIESLAIQINKVISHNKEAFHCMIDIETYLASGIIESYVFALASPEENAEVEKYMLEYPEIGAAIDACSNELELHAMANGVEPDPIIKPFLMASIDFMDRMQKGEEPTIAPLIQSHSQISDYAAWLNRPDMFLPEGINGPYAKIISYTPSATTAIVWIKDMAPKEVHHDEYESFLIVEGSCDITIGTTVHQLVPGSVLSIPLHQTHSVKITSTIPCKVILQRVAA